MRKTPLASLLLIVVLAGAAAFSAPRGVSAANYQDGTLQFRMFQGNREMGPGVKKDGGQATVQLELKTCDPNLNNYAPGMRYESLYLLPPTIGSERRETIKSMLRPAIDAVKTIKGDPWTELHRPYDWKITSATGTIMATGTVEKGDWNFADDRWNNTTLGEPAGIWTFPPSGDVRGDACGGSNAGSSMWFSWYQKASASFDPTSFPVGFYDMTFCHGPRDDKGARTDCNDGHDKYQFSVTTTQSPRGNIFVEARDTDGNLLPAASESWKFVSVPDKQTQPADSKNKYYNVIQGQYVIEAGNVPGYALDSIKTANGNLLALGGANKNQAMQWLCSFSPTEKTVTGAGDCVSFSAALNSSNSTRVAAKDSFFGSLVSWIKNLIPSANAAVSSGDSYCEVNPLDAECSGWTDPTLGGGGVTGGGGGGFTPGGRHISFILVYKKSPTPPPSDAGGNSTSTATSSVTGDLVFSPSNIKDKDSFSIKLQNVNSSIVPDSSVVKLFIDSGEGNGFENFGDWLTVGALKAGVNRTLNCKAYTSYKPGQTLDVSGKTLNQRVYVSYSGTTSSSTVASHVKDCSTTSGGGGGGGGSAGDNVHVITAGSGVTWRVKDPLSQSFAPADTQGSYKLTPGKNYLLSVTAPNHFTVSVNGSNVNLYTDNPLTGVGYPFSVPASGDVNISISVSAPSGPVNVSYSISPANATVAVGETVQFHATITVNGDSANADNLGIWQTDPFYLKPGPTKGSFIGVNPGLATVRLASVGTLASATVSVTGSSSSSGSGKIRISSSKDITKILFPDPNCGAKGKGCVVGGNGSFAIIPGADGPQLIADSWMSTVDFPAKNDVARVNLYSLSDPMNPTPNAPYRAELNADQDTAGDYGPYLSISYGAAASKDGSYQFGVQNQGMSYGFQDGTKRLLAFDTRFGGGIFNVVEYGDNVYLLSGVGVQKVTDVANMPTPDNRPDTPWVKESAMTPPSNFPKLGIGPKIAMDGDYLASIYSNSSVTGGSVDFSSPKLAVFKLGKSSAVSSVDVGSIFPTQARENIGGYAFPGKNFFSVSVGSAQYIFIIMPPTGAGTYGDWAYPYQAQTLYGFKFDGTTLTKVIDGLKIDPGFVRAAAPFKLGGDAGIIVKMDKYLGIDGGYTKTENRARIYLLSDLLSGTVKDALANSPVTSQVGGWLSDHMATLEKDGVTYVYMGGGGNGGQAPAYVWKLESGSGSSDGGGGTGGGGGGGVSPSSGSCDFTLTPSPASVSAKQGTFYAIVGLKASASDNPFCAISVTLPTLRDTSGTRVIYPDSADPVVIAPGSQGSAILNIQNATPGSYTVDMKASARGVSAKTVSVPITITSN